MTDSEVEAAFRKMRWPETGGDPVCPTCGTTEVYNLATRITFKCKACQKQFSMLSGTIFNYAKMPIRSYLQVIAFAAASENALQLSRKMGIQYKTAWSLVRKIRQAMGRREPEHPPIPRRKRKNYYLDCEHCGARFLDKKGEKSSALRRGKHKHAFCSRTCYGQYRADARADDRCKRCKKSRRELSKMAWLTATGVTGVTFKNGYCPKCDGLRRAYGHDEVLFQLHEINQQLRKETTYDYNRKKHSRPEKTSTGGNRRCAKR